MSLEIGDKCYFYKKPNEILTIVDKSYAKCNYSKSIVDDHDYKHPYNEYHYLIRYADGRVFQFCGGVLVKHRD